MYCCSNFNYEQLVECYEKCIFCLGKFNEQHKFLIYNNGSFKINNKVYHLNCICRPYCHLSCMKSWIIESERCPECSVYFTEIIEKKYCTFENLCACFLIFFFVSTVCLVIIGVIIQNKHIL